MSHFVAKCGTLLLLLGIATIGYTLYSNWHTNQVQASLKQTFATGLDQGREVEAKIQSVASKSNTNKQTSTISQNVNGLRVQGILTVPKLNLEAAIVEGADPEQLQSALGHIRGGGEAGQINSNYSIAGHRSSRYGKFFNRLHELNKHDAFQLQTSTGKYAYQVYDIQIVEPDQVEVLQPESGQSIVTLITCYPDHSSQYRLIVKGKLVSQST
ncbi:class D sortase [Paenibacillus sp. PsM32]|uniref:class D sortase n=1 Tax=Paenibacillus sp. PsM32 TaxID=3030536 RepID=UPI00263A4C40|nr:class D sortase [Paenibacillus sp. PsM32]MDN4616784.1 class D sortase [Paenibacillus sp. PsM32]